MAHGDLTGNTKAALAKKKQAEEDAKAAALAKEVASQEADKSDEPIELEDARTPDPQPVRDPDSEVETVDVEKAEKVITFKVNSNLESVTIGHGNTYDFTQGQTYKAPQFVYDHLEEKGLIWH